MQQSFEQTLAGKYAQLSARLQQAADFVMANPIDVATRSLRSIARDARLTPVTFSRMSAALGYENYEALREVLRRSMEQRSNMFSTRVAQLQEQHVAGDHGFHADHFVAVSKNLKSLSASIDLAMLENCVDRLHSARKVLVIGGLGSAGIAEYLTYMTSFIADNWSLGNRVGTSLGSGLVGLAASDVLIVITKTPYATQSILAAEDAHAAGVFVIVLTDNHSCPALKYASAAFIVPSDSPHYFSSYAGTLVLTEVLTGMLASRAEGAALDRIAAVEIRNRRLKEVWSDK
ncbi:MAG: hypothetical protein VR78_12600 [Hoeflea sp. BRH_c9]|nr:MAG: hypothetical protein VR78_12600 [Hoeflea sp. BRH_c9]